jgi:hypothetical protein
VLAPRVVPHFDNHALADRPMFMDDNARPHRARIVQHFFTARGCSDNSMACDVARHEPYRACMGLYWPKNSRTYKSNLQSKEKQPQTVTPPPPKAVVPKMWLS